MLAIAALPAPFAAPAATDPATPETMWLVWCRGLAMTALGLAGFLAWSAWMPLQQTLSGPGMVALGTAGAKPRDPQAARAELGTAQRRLMMMESSHERLLALAAGASSLRFSSRVAAIAAAEGAAGDRLLATQHALFLYQSELRHVDWADKLAELEQQQWALQARIDELREAARSAPLPAPVSSDGSVIVEARLAAEGDTPPEPGLVAELQLQRGGLRSTRIQGQVLSVAAVRQQDRRSGRDYWQVKIAVPADEQQRLARSGHAMSAGLPLEVRVPLAPHSLLSHLAKPLQA
jgi:hypothetical protein